ncbi:tetratricopeptide repeat protein [Streptomyces sp. NPDC050738]|uniref:tetratricopeptide repeat protein n=1 Tax=Streptomyces sp. NPDC050738 TaxID=3154744 RepID=UPI00341B906F
MQDLIRRRRHAGFVGRRDELGAYRANFGIPPEDERHRFLYHVHGTAGVGKTSLVRRLEDSAREHGALVAYVDEAVNSIPEAMAAISAQFAQQGHVFKALDRMLATYRQRRHEAESAVVAPEPGVQPPSAGSMIASQAGLFTLRMVPVVGGVVADAMDPAQLAQGADRLRAALSSRLRNQDDVQLVMDPLQALTPVLVRELCEAAEAAPWIALFFDTYERTGPLLDNWLRDLLTSDRYGELPAATVVTLAGQGSLDARCWADFAEFVEEFPLERFTAAEARSLLAGKGITDERVVEVILRLSGRLPVLVSALAENRPTDPGAVGDPSGTAVERFLKWEADPVRRSAALAGALPRELNDDVFRVAVEARATELFAWLRELPFVRDRAGRAQYHDVVRTAMLRLQRTNSPQRWNEAHTRLAEAYAGWREAAGAGMKPAEQWSDDTWNALRREEDYHLLCAGSRAALPGVLRDLADACDCGLTVARAWVQMLLAAGEDTDDADLAVWAGECRTALADESDDESDEQGIVRVLTLVLTRAELDRAGRVLTLMVRGRELRELGETDRALRDYDAALALSPDESRAHFGRAMTRKRMRDLAGALPDFDRAVELGPDTEWFFAERGDLHWQADRNEAAIADLDRALELEPDTAWSLAIRGAAKDDLGRKEDALADLDRSLEVDPDYVWALVRRSDIRLALDDNDGCLADLDRAFALSPDSKWVASERGDTYRILGRYEEALVELDRALALDPQYAPVLAARGVSLHKLGRPTEALDSLDRAVELAPDYAWARARRVDVRLRHGVGGHSADAVFEAVLADLARCVETGYSPGWALGLRAEVHLLRGRPADVLADYETAPPEVRTDDIWADNLSDAYRQLGQFDRARECAELLRADDPIEADGRLAMLTSRMLGTAEAAPLWRRVLAYGDEVEPTSAIAVHCALGDWATADAGLADYPVAEISWQDRATLVYYLREMSGHRGADPTRFELRLRRAQEIMDAR